MIRRVRPSSASPDRPGPRSGQAILESFGIILLLCLMLFGMVQYVLMLTASEVVQYSADASVRARAVGFNPFMVFKVNRVASIPNAGLMTNPSRQAFGNATTWNTQSAGRAYFSAIQASPRSSQYWEIEYTNIPFFLGSAHYGQMYGYLDYEDWDTISRPMYTATAGDTVGVTVRQDYPLRMPLFRAFSDDDEIRIRKEARLADHAELYLE